MNRYRNGVYVAFDGQGTTNPTQSDIKYYNLLKLWAAQEDLIFSDSHKKTGAVRDSSAIDTLKRRLRERLSKSKSMFLILSEETNYDRGVLNYEIEQAIDTYKIPLIIAYTGKKGQIAVNSSDIKNRWPRALIDRIDNNDVTCVHIGFEKEIIKRAISQISVHDNKYKGGKLTYKS